MLKKIWLFYRRFRDFRCLKCGHKKVDFSRHYCDPLCPYCEGISYLVRDDFLL